jgi:hypothetical protein
MTEHVVDVVVPDMSNATTTKRVVDDCDIQLTESCVGLPLEGTSSNLSKVFQGDISPVHIKEDSDDDNDGNNDKDNINVLQDGSNTNQQQKEQSSSSSTTHQNQQYTTSLEERVQELEEKLATLSLILQRQQQQQYRRPSPPRSPPGSGDESDDTLSYMMTMTSRSGLDSPFPYHKPSKGGIGTHKRNLSYHVLHTEDFTRTPESVDTIRNNDDDDMIDDLIDDHNNNTNNGDGDERGAKGVVKNNGGASKSPENIFLPQDLSGTSRVSITTDFDGQSIPSTLLKPTTKDLEYPILHPPDIEIIKPSGEEIQEKQQQQQQRQEIAFNKGEILVNGKSESPLKQKSSVSAEKSISSASLRKDSTNGSIAPLPVDNNNNKRASLTTNMKSKWLDYLNSVQETHYDTDKQMEEFVKVPSAVEALLSFGFWICVDSFLYTLTILPIRFVWSCVLLVRFMFLRVFKSSKAGEGPFRFHRRHSYQLIQMSIIYSVYKYVLKPIDISIIYHWIRVQSMVKLYLLIAIVEVFDRLMCSLGQDCLDSLYWNTTRRPRSSRLIVSILVVLTYTAVHSTLLFVHVATLVSTFDLRCTCIISSFIPHSIISYVHD